jgi:hypothetical protein
MVKKHELKQIIHEFLNLDVFDRDAPTGKSKELLKLEKRARKALGYALLDRS